jgi:hypothetical protein
MLWTDPVKKPVVALHELQSTAAVIVPALAITLLMKVTAV